MNNDPKLCSSCGTPLDAAAPGGLCPRCLMASAMAPTESGTNTRPITAPPTVEQVAAAFPQLEVQALIGSGGMGAVFRARQPKLNRLVALKVLPASLAERDPAFAERFEREGQMLARLHHPNIVTVYDSGRAGDFFFLLMEHVDGVNLRQAMRARRFTPAQALGIVPKICDALQFAHDEGVLHRDIKPENILLDSKGRVKLADFGIGKIVGEPGEPVSAQAPASGDPTLTQPGAALGTPQYMAPEQRDRPAEVDHRADIYSLGVVFYELLTGELPVGKFAPPSEISASDPRVDAIVRQALEKERGRRQESANEMKTQVEGVASTPPPEYAEAMSGEMLARDYTLDIGSCISRGWALVRGDFWPFIGITALVLALLSAAGGFTMSISASSGFDHSSFGHTAPNTSLLSMLLGGPLIGGLYLYYLKKIRGEAANVETVFSGFSPRFLHLFLGSFVTWALTWLGFLCLILPGIYLFVVWLFTMPLIIDKRLEFWPAMQLGRKMVSKHFWQVFAFSLVLGLLCFAGCLALIVGIFFVTPVAIAALMYAYEDIFNAPKRVCEASRAPAAAASPVTAV